MSQVFTSSLPLHTFSFSSPSSISHSFPSFLPFLLFLPFSLFFASSFSSYSSSHFVFIILPSLKMKGGGYTCGRLWWNLECKPVDLACPLWASFYLCFPYFYFSFSLLLFCSLAIFSFLSVIHSSFYQFYWYLFSFLFFFVYTCIYYFIAIFITIWWFVLVQFKCK